ncbi:MAG: class I SAM-dependent methyltransferase [Anaerovoracaceae bacterium]
MAYTYPDENDRLTCEMIETQFDGEYWGKSEDLVLGQALEEANLLAAARRNAGQKVQLLDLGCGMGRLFQTFAAVADEITGAEPDPGRFAVAEKEGRRVAGEAGIPVHVINGDASALPEGKQFDIIVSSHVMQHITCRMAEDLMKTMADKLRPDGLLVLTTTYTDGGEDRFSGEGWKDGQRWSQYVNREEFDSLFGCEGMLPVRMFSPGSLCALAENAGLELLQTSMYHYQNHHSAEEDLEANLSGDGAGARDAMYLFQKPKKRMMDGNINYHFSFSIFDEETGLRTDDERELRSSIRKAFPDAIFDDDPEAMNEPLFQQLKIGQEFLHGGGLPFHCFRALLKNYQLSFGLETKSYAGVRKKTFDIRSSSVFMTVFPESDTVQVCVCLSVKDASPDDFVYFRHVQGNGAKLRNQDGRLISVREIFQEVSSSLNRKVTDVAETYLLEIRQFDQYTQLEDILEKEKTLIYGLMTGDEGWRHVPEHLAEERLTNQWGSRDFVRLISFGANSVVINLADSSRAEHYRAGRMIFDHTYYGEMNPYFSMDSEIAGVNHGILFSAELVMVIKTICNRILRRQANYYSGGQGNKLRAEIRKIKAYRGELITTLNRVENLSISEIGELERVLLISQQIEPIIEKIKYLLELLESELDLLYQTSTNRLINFLTVAGLILAAWQVILAIM